MSVFQYSNQDIASEEGHAVVDESSHTSPNREWLRIRTSVVAGVTGSLMIVAVALASRAYKAEMPLPLGRNVDVLRLDSEDTEGDGKDSNLNDLVKVGDYDCIVEMFPSIAPENESESWSMSSIKSCGDCHGAATHQNRNEETSINVITKAKAQVKFYNDVDCQSADDDWSLDVPKDPLKKKFTMVGVKLRDKYNSRISSFKCICS